MGGGPDGCGCCCVTMRAAKSPRCCLGGTRGTRGGGHGALLGFLQGGCVQLCLAGAEGLQPISRLFCASRLAPSPFWVLYPKAMARARAGAFVKGENSPICAYSPCCRPTVGTGVCPLSLGTPAAEGPVSLPRITSLSLHPPRGHRARKRILMPAENTGS